MRGGNGTALLAAVVLSGFVGCALEPDGDEARLVEDADDPAVEPGETCEPYATSGCFEGNVHAVDSCGETLELLDECSGSNFCQPGVPSCCAPGLESGDSLLDEDPYVTRGTLDLDGVATELQWQVEILESSATEPYKQYVIVTGVGTDRFAIQLMGNNSALGAPAVGLSSWDRGDNAVRTEADGIVEPAELGSYIGVRRPYAWGEGVYTIRLARSGESSNGEDLYELSIQGSNEAEPTVIGAVGAAPGTGEEEAQLSASHTHYLYNYSGAADIADVEAFAVRSTPMTPETEVTLVTSQYSPFPNTEIRWESGALYMRMGLGTARCTAAGELYAGE